MRQDTDFAEWLEAEIQKRGWRPAELAKAAGLYQSTVWKVLNRERTAGSDVCTALARAMKLPPELVFRKAGLLPELPASEDDPTFSELLSYVKRLSTKDRREVLKYALFRYQEAQAAPAASEQSSPASGGGPSVMPAR